MQSNLLTSHITSTTNEIMLEDDCADSSEAKINCRARCWRRKKARWVHDIEIIHIFQANNLICKMRPHLECPQKKTRKDSFQINFFFQKKKKKTYLEGQKKVRC